MRNFKNFKFVLTLIVMTALITNFAKATDECFEETSRAIFKFNMVLDDIVLEPLAKGYNKLPSPIRAGSKNFTSNISRKSLAIFFLSKLKYFIILKTNFLLSE